MRRLLLVGVLGVASGSLQGHEHPPPWHHDHEIARTARARGEIRPIAEILRQVNAQVPGQLLDAELKGGKKGRPWVYELKLLTPDGRRLELRVDAHDGRVLKMEDED